MAQGASPDGDIDAGLRDWLAQGGDRGPPADEICETHAAVVFLAGLLVLFGFGSLLLLYFGWEVLLTVAVEIAFGYVSGRTAVRLSPNGESQGVNDSDPFSLFPAGAAALSEIGIAFLELREPPRDGTFGKAEVDPVHPHIRKAFAGPLVLNSDFTLARAQAEFLARESSDETDAH